MTDDIAILKKSIKDSIDLIPQKMHSRRGELAWCCVCRDRALIKYRCMESLGFPPMQLL